MLSIYLNIKNKLLMVNNSLYGKIIIIIKKTKNFICFLLKILGDRMFIVYVVSKRQDKVNVVPYSLR